MNAINADETMIRQEDDEDGDGIGDVVYAKVVLDHTITAADVFNVSSPSSGVSYYYGDDFGLECISIGTYCCSRPFIF